ncbi:hypothetical protein O0I10_010495 [Lichtheimia ornata]|uniref:AAA+ ATPase domain-containing protein n=1 Tax=Lichtheimia ornata TaxID=688661 RepID=A0AAD7UUI6_9FUNG|nr:uncharacterized protein O0I10_010495 [Lichtheimia ornata]KAJ8653814.1 hypothetical protein O0I10_010495 [Lichtheimia ornata]
MSAVLFARLGRSTLPSKAQWVARTSYQRLARASTAAGRDAPATEDNSNNNATAAATAPTTPPPRSSSSSEPPIDESKAFVHSMLDAASPNGSKGSSDSSRGRKISRKSRRSFSVLPKSFLNSNYTPHSSIKVQALHPSYAESFTEQLWHELRFAVQTGLAPKGALASSNHADHLLLNVPGRGATYMQDNIAKRLAADVGADLIVFDPQDFIALAQASDSNGQSTLSASQQGSIDSKGQPSIVMFVDRDQSILDDKAIVGDEFSTEFISKLRDMGFPPLQELYNRLEQRLQEAEEAKDATTTSTTEEETTTTTTTKPSEEMYSKFNTMFNRMLMTGDDKNPSSPKIVYLRDYERMRDHLSLTLREALMDSVEQLRQKGHRIIALAGYSPSLTTKYQNYKRSLSEFDIPLMPGMKCISVPPPMHDTFLFRSWETQLEVDAAKRIGEINARQILMALKQKDVIGIKGFQGSQTKMVAELSNLEGIQKSLWQPGEIDRHVTCAIGNALSSGKTMVTLDDFVVATNFVRHNMDQRKQVKRLLDKQRITIDMDNNEPLNIHQLQKYCDSYESRFLSRIVDPYKVHGSFADVRVPQTTIDTLQSLITLPLVRPDVFRKGILKDNFISGVLLFGPPGTGKTMLAKAVAKESGSRMLEIQASDIYEMYVGEGEKNVKALFSLARKLSPCVVFIDEVDSLLGRRRSDSSSNSRREIINQFMVEWDGLSSDNQGVMVMAATNRPFDLDDAVLRRMPRRILVDLPKEDDRMEILKLLLRDEEHEVSLAELAHATEHYSGSDLKNLCVTTALRAVQQEVSSKKKRILTQAHFDEALKLVRPSSAEDMDSLVEIRKWAAKYGDGGSERKKQAIGFS